MNRIASFVVALSLAAAGTTALAAEPTMMTDAQMDNVSGGGLVDIIIANRMQNAATAQRTIADAVERIAGARTCGCQNALATAIITQPALWPEQTKKELMPIIGKYAK